MHLSDRDYRVQDYAALWDMVQAIRLIQEFLTSLSYEEYLNHRYEQVQQDRIWAIVTVELIDLLTQLEALLPDEI